MLLLLKGFNKEGSTSIALIQAALPLFIEPSLVESLQ
jgi:hypothetical protein